MAKLLPLCLLALAATATAGAGEVPYTTTEVVSNIGTTKAESYDVATLVKGENVTGTTIKSITVPVPSSSLLIDYSIWLSSSLSLGSDNTFTPSIASATVDKVSDLGKVTVTWTLDQPYTIGEEGVFVGYSFTVKRAVTTTAKYPLYYGEDNAGYGLYIHTSDTYPEWSDVSAYGYGLPLSIVLEGDFPNNKLTLNSVTNPVSAVGKAATVSFICDNNGGNAVNSFDVAYTLNGTDYTQTFTPELPLTAELSNPQTFSFDLPAMAAEGDYPFTFTIAKVNGEENVATEKTADAGYSVISNLPTHRALMEEYTGTWCGFCPRGFAAMQYLSKRYDDFIGIAFHNDDPMMVDVELPFTVSGYPGCTIDRGEELDPYYGPSTSSSFQIEKYWKEACNVAAPVDITLSADFAADDATRIDVKTNIVSPIARTTANYMVAYALVADGLTTADYETDDHGGWRQLNNFYTTSATGFIDEMAQFCGTTSYVNLVYEDVVILAPDIMGIEGSVPATLAVGNNALADYSFDTKDAVSDYYYSKGESLVQDPNNLRVVAMVIDGVTGRVLNANVAKVGDSASLGSVFADGDAVTTEYYDLMGRRVLNPAAGIFIRRDTFANGHATTSKVALK